MTSFLRYHRTMAVSALATWASSSAMAQQVIRQRCDFEFSTTAAAVVVPPAPVPSMTMLGGALLVAMVALAAWRLGRFPGARFMAAALVAAAALLANQGGGGLVQKAYAAALSLTNPAGETQSGNELYGNPITLTNNAGVPLLLKKVYVSDTFPPGVMGSCKEGSTLAPGASCTGTASCVNSCGSNENSTPESPNGCACQEMYARAPANFCIPEFDCSSSPTWNGWEYTCN